MPEAVKSPLQVADELIAAWNDHDPDRAAALYAADFEGQDVAQVERQHGPRDIHRMTAYYFRAFPDLQVSLLDRVAAGDRVVLVWTWRGTHRATFMRIPPTGRAVTVRGTTILTIKAGLIRNSTRIWDLAGLLRGLGLLPDL
jgi:steroid delta-isomerase-like uncharacterized protein